MIAITTLNKSFLQSIFFFKSHFADKTIMNYVAIDLYNWQLLSLNIKMIDSNGGIGDKIITESSGLWPPE